MKIFFSIVIPTLNEEKYLPSLLLDLVAQSFRNFEVIVVDGKSRDKTILESEKFSIKLPHLSILLDQKRNVSIQRNLGAKKAKGEWLIFMDADNRLPEHFLEGIKYKIAESNVDCFTCWSNPDGDSTAEKAITQLVNLVLEVRQVGALGSMIGAKKIAFDASRGFNPKTGFGEDLDFVRSLISLGFNYEVFRDPRYTYSLRRMRKEGLLAAAGKYAKLFLKKLANYQIDQKSEYPMGGDYFIGSKPTRGSLVKLDKKLRAIFNKPSLLRKIKSLIEIENY